MARILCGEVRVDGARVRDPRFPADGGQVSLERRRFVSRGGLKLDGALGAYGPPVEGMCLLDAGCSTGGFTDCLLQRGAARVIAVDVGYGQLDYRLRRDPRVTLLERTNILSLTADKPAGASGRGRGRPVLPFPAAGPPRTCCRSLTDAGWSPW